MEPEVQLNGVVLPPSNELQRAAMFLERSCGRFLQARGSATDEGWHQYEHLHAAHSLIALIIRHVEAVATLSRTDVVLLPAAATLSRTCFEVAIRAQWLLAVEDPFVGEARYLSLLAEEESIVAALVSEGIGDEANLTARRDFRRGVESLLPDGVRVPKKPNLRQMLIELGEEERYLTYRLLSQYAHGTFFATAHYQQNLGTAKVHLENINESMWKGPLNIAFFSVGRTGSMWLERVSASQFEFVSSAWKRAVDRSISLLGSEDLLSEG